MMSQRIARTAVFCAGLLLAGAHAARAECASSAYCEVVNRPDARIFTARVLHPLDDGFAWRVRVTRTFRGKASGSVDVYINGDGEYLSPAKLAVGTEYLLVVHPEWMPGYRRILSNGTGCAWPFAPWRDVNPGDRAYLKGLSGAQPDGRVFGDIDLDGPSRDFTPMANTRVRLRGPSGGQVAMIITDNLGRFEFRGLFPGDYRVTADVPGREFELDEDGGDDGKVTLLPHACQEVGLLFKHRDR